MMASAFLMQFMVQGAWGVIPAHLNEMAPNELRGFFPGFAYQIGVLCAASVPLVEALLTKHMSYAQSLGLMAGAVLLAGIPIIALGPEAKGVAFGTKQALDT
jgi:SHS family lactate transporter-like MFS transporter